MIGWQRYFFGGVASVRPYLLAQLVLTLLTFDAWVAMSRHAAYYGTTSFNVSHAAWIDSVQVLPTAAYHLFFVIGTGFAALFLVLRGLTRPLLILLAPFYTYTWAMSRLDSYTHHYLLSILLFSLMFWPLSAINPQKVQAGDRISAWAYAMLGATVGIIFFYCAMAKVDTAWRSGATLLAMGGPEALYKPVQELFARLGISRALFWQSLSVSVIFLELGLAVIYILAVRQDSAPSPYMRLACWLGWLLAMVLHLGNELLQLDIRWFSYYMALLGCVFFLPERWLVTFASPWLWLHHYGPSASSRYALPRRWRNTPVSALLTCGAAATVVSLTLAIDLPGASAVAYLLGGLILLGSVPALILRPQEQWTATLCAAVLTSVIGWGTFHLSSARGEFYRHLGDEQYLAGSPAPALKAYVKATKYLPHRSHHQAEVQNNMGTARVALQQPETAVTRFQAAIRMRPDYAEAHKNLAGTLATLDRHAQAAEHYKLARHHAPEDPETALQCVRYLAVHASAKEALAEGTQALTTITESADLHAQLAAVYLQTKDAEQAARHLQRALELAPQSIQRQMDFAVTLIMLGRAAEAVPYLEAVLEREPEHADARLNLASAFQQLGQDAEATCEFERVLVTTPDDGNVRGALALTLLRQGNTQAAIQQFQQAVYDLPDDAALRSNFAIALARGDRIDDAIAELTFAAELDPNNQKILANLSILKTQRAASNDQ